MIAFLTGRLAFKAPTHLTLDVQGVGYEVHIPLSTYYALPNLDDVTALNIHTHLREDAIQLFGFATPLELSLFDRLVAVSGIGPRLALGLLSGIAPAELVQAVATGDVARLVSIPGIGKKTAERIVLELKDKLVGVTPSATSAADGTRADLVSALVNLGYHRPAAETAVDHALKSAPAGGFEQALRSALRSLTR